MSLEAKIDAVLKDTADIKVELAKSLVHQAQHRKEIDEYGTEIKNLKANQNKAIGIFTVIGLAVTSFFGWLFNKH